MKKFIVITLVVSMILILCACSNSKKGDASFQVVKQDSSTTGVFLSSGNSKIAPIFGMTLQFTTNPNGSTTILNGTGVSDYIEKLKTDSDFDVPTIKLKGNVEIQIGSNSEFNSIYCINPSVSWDKNESTLDEIAGLDKGEYYIIIKVTTKVAMGRETNEYLFKLSVA